VVSRIESFWPGARVYDHHGMTEIGSVSYPCPQRQGVLHVIESSYVAEIIDPQNGHPAMLGATGELVLTNLGRTGSPLLRYRTGDLVRAESAGQCSCGSWDLALAGGILGRLDDMVVIRGVNVYPSAVEDIVRSFPDIADFRAEIRKRREMAELRLLIEPSAECPHPSELEALLQGKLRATLALRVSVDVVPVGTLPHFELKTNRWIRR
jgi:phenylacetate-CoA ligase